jgi:hypothetical protein
MSEDGEPPPVVLDEHTNMLIEGLVQSGVQAAIAARVGDTPGTHATASSGAGAVTPRSHGLRPARSNGCYGAEHPRGGFYALGILVCI